MWIGEVTKMKSETPSERSKEAKFRACSRVLPECGSAITWSEGTPASTNSWIIGSVSGLSAPDRRSAPPEAITCGPCNCR